MIREYIDYLVSNKHYSNNTAAAYERDLRDFARWASRKGLRWSTITQNDVEAYAREKAEEAAAATINRHVTSIRSIYNWMMHTGRMTTNPARYVVRAKKAERLPNTIPGKDIEEAIAHSDIATATAIRLLWKTGIRIGEMMTISRQDYDAEGRCIRIHGKGKKDRMVYMDEKTAEMMTTYVTAMPTRYTRPFELRTERGWRYLIYTNLLRVSNAKQLSPHALRHTYAQNMIDAGMPTTTLKQLMGHDDIRTTDKYVGLTNQELKQAYDKYTN